MEKTTSAEFLQDWIPTMEAARMVGLHREAIASAQREGRLPFVRHYGRNLVHRSELAAYIMRTQGRQI